MWSERNTLIGLTQTNWSQFRNWTKRKIHSHQEKVDGWERAATAVRATTNGSIADKTWEESVCFWTSTTPSSGHVPKYNSEEFPSLLCHPTFPPINGDEVVEHATTRRESIPLEPFNFGYKPKHFFFREIEELRLGLKLPERRRRIGLKVVEYWSFSGGGYDNNGIVNISSTQFRRVK